VTQTTNGASQAMLYAVGMTKQTMKLPQIGISGQYLEGNPCNADHILKNAEHIKNSVERSNMTGFRFMTSSVSDGISMGTSGMNYSLVSRDVIADSIEMTMKGQWYDGYIGIPGCDKNIPGNIIAVCRLNRPSILVYGGAMKSGICSKGNKIDIVSAFQSYGQHESGQITEKERQYIVENACSKQGGACPGVYTANSMAIASEALGLSLPHSSSSLANSTEKIEECKMVGLDMRRLLEMDLKPLDIVTKRSFENAIVTVIALGGSTNIVLHLIAAAKACKIDLNLNHFQSMNDRVPYIGNLKPSGEYLMEDLYEIGGTPSFMRYLAENRMLHLDEKTVTGKTLGENLMHADKMVVPNKVIYSFYKPIKKTGHINILYGNIAEKGCVSKITGKEGTFFKGKAMVFDLEQDMLNALKEGKIKKNNKTVIIIRYQGPSVGMPEMLKPTSSIMGYGLGDDVALITDGRFSGGSHGFIIGHVCPEAYKGGNIGLIKDDDLIQINIDTKEINMLVSNEELEIRKKNYKIKTLYLEDGALNKFSKLVSDASDGCYVG
jgi:dihydroxy-acid dehydratase